MTKLITLFAVSTAAILIRIYYLSSYSFPFPQDMGRDLLWAKDISFYFKPTLIGPAASIWGVYFGPLWFYFLSVPLKIFGGHPISAVYATQFLIILSGVLAFILFEKGNKPFAFLLTVIILFNSLLISLSTFAFHANALPILTLFVIFFFYKAVIKNPLNLAVVAFFVSLMFHADPAPAFVFTLIIPILIFIFRLFEKKNFLKAISFSFLTYVIPFLPQIVFEFRNDFLQTRALSSYFLGKNPSLSGQLPLVERIGNRFDILINFVIDYFAGENLFFAVLLIFLIIYGLIKFYKQFNPDFLVLFKINFYCVLLFFLIFTIINVELKGWYLYGLAIPFSFLWAASLTKVSRKLKLIFLIIFLILNINNIYNSKKLVAFRKDPSNYNNIEKAVNYTYNNAEGKDFSVYVYTPPIYDHQYQYMFWWQGIVLKKGFPQEVTYLPEKPQYIINKEVYQKSTTKGNLIYLIIENALENQFYAKSDWINSFNDYKIIQTKNINEAILVEKRVKEDINNHPGLQ